MPAEVDYSKRGIWENIWDPGAWQNLLGGVGSVAGDVATAWEKIEKVEGSKPLSLPSEPLPYEHGLTWRDFKFTPNVTLILIGCGLLGLAWFLKKR